MEDIVCIYRTHNYELKNKSFKDYAGFGEWIANNACNIIIVDVIKGEEVKKFLRR